MQIPHLQYTDDTLIFCETEKEQVRMLKVILFYLKKVLGYTNWGKILSKNG